MNSTRNRWFFNFSAGMLLLTAAAKLYSATGPVKLLHTQDQLLHVEYRPILVWSALLEIAIAVFVLTNRGDLKRAVALLWLSANFALYHFGNYLLGFHNCPCLGHLTDRLPLPPGLAEVVLNVLVLYWLLNSVNIIWEKLASAPGLRLLWPHNERQDASSSP